MELIDNLDQCDFIFVALDFGLIDFERDLTLFVATYKSSDCQPVEQIFARVVFGVNVE